ncbi:hypothetical protein ACFQ0G_47455 [Streptomyces chiangmaiensis]
MAVVRRSDTVSAPDQAAAAAKAGARQLLILNDGYGKFDPWADLPEGAPCRWPRWAPTTRRGC